MSGSTAEIQELSDRILKLLGKRIMAGELVIRYSEGIVMRCETRTVHRLEAGPLVRQPLDTETG